MIERKRDTAADRQMRALERALHHNASVATILERAPCFGLPDWYLGAGAVTGTVWNVLHGLDPGHGIKDYDLVYFDAGDLTASGEAAVEEEARGLFSDLGVTIDVTNEARTHLWYEQRFGRPIPPYRSSAHAISTWPTTASSVGVRYEAGVFTVCAPFGLDDLFGMVVRPNKALVDEVVYTSKARRWAATWPRLHVLPW